MAGDSYSSCIGTSRTNGIRSIQKRSIHDPHHPFCSCQTRSHLPGAAWTVPVSFPGHPAGGKIPLLLAAWIQGGPGSITESAYLKRTRRKRFHTVVRDRQDFRHHGSYAIPTVQPIRAGRVSNFFPLKLMHAPLSTRRSSWCRKASATTEASRKVSGLESRFHSWTGEIPPSGTDTPILS